MIIAEIHVYFSSDRRRLGLCNVNAILSFYCNQNIDSFIFACETALMPFRGIYSSNGAYFFPRLLEEYIPLMPF